MLEFYFRVESDEILMRSHPNLTKCETEHIRLSLIEFIEAHRNGKLAICRSVRATFFPCTCIRFQEHLNWNVTAVTSWHIGCCCCRSGCAPVTGLLTGTAVEFMGPTGGILTCKRDGVDGRDVWTLKRVRITEGPRINRHKGVVPNPDKMLIAWSETFNESVWTFFVRTS